MHGGVAAANPSKNTVSCPESMRRRRPSAVQGSKAAATMGFPAASSSLKEVTESQRALELRKFFAPYLPTNGSVATKSQLGFNDSLTSDGALDAYAETIIWRLKGVHAMVTLIDRLDQYFIAGAFRKGSSDEGDTPEASQGWFGCSTVQTPGGLCELQNTLALDLEEEEYPCFIVNDLAADARFAQLPVVDGSVAAYRFYAGTPITTSNGIRIGSFFLFDDRPRVEFSTEQRKCLHHQAANVMRHLEAKREAAQRRRVALMSQGIATFFDRISRETEPALNHYSVPANESSKFDHLDQQIPQDDERHDAATAAQEWKKSSASAKLSVLDQIRTTLDHAADVIRQSFELTSGGVVFLDAALGYNEIRNKDDTFGFAFSELQQTEPDVPGEQKSNQSSKKPAKTGFGDVVGRHLSQGSVRSSTDADKSSRILAISTADNDPKPTTIDWKTLQSLIISYPKGNVWYIDDNGFVPSLEMVKNAKTIPGTSNFGGSSPILPMDVVKQNSEANKLSKMFSKAKQVIFLPLWDASADRWHSGCFLWSPFAVPVFSVDPEITCLTALTNCVMGEINRLDAIIANNMKSDFISSISHEFRSPLHGILASVEFLRESYMDNEQIEFASTIQNCSATLLDTINHVLDYSKINSFEKEGNQSGSIANELYEAVNVALLCEKVVSGMTAANQFVDPGSGDISPPLPNKVLPGSTRQVAHTSSEPTVEVIMDIERHDWEFNVQAGAIGRIIMNLLGNAQKYTTSGYILVQLGIQESLKDVSNQPRSNTRTVLLLRIRDSGRGMSAEYMERKLYRPFAQEDSFASGVGLGLSIVWSIINQLGGKIHIRSEVGKGTDVEVTLPLEKVNELQLPHTRPPGMNDAEETIRLLREFASGKYVLVSRPEPKNKSGVARFRNLTCDSIESYCSEWFGFQVIRGKEENNFKLADLVILDQCHESAMTDLSCFAYGQRILLVHENMKYRQDQKQDRRPVGHISSPIGPFKLARCILALFDQDISNRESKIVDYHKDAGTQTPLASPGERIQESGTAMTDYGFTLPPTLSISPDKSSIMEDRSIKTDILSNDPEIKDHDNGGEVVVPHQPSLSQPPFRSGYAIQSQNRAQSSEPTIPRQPVGPLSQSLPEDSEYGLHILAVDDNAVNLQLVQRYLLKRKCDTVVTARNGEEAVIAVRNARDENKNFDVIFMDISMPVIDGFEATRLIRTMERSSRQKSFIGAKVQETDSIRQEVEEKNGPNAERLRVFDEDVDEDNIPSLRDRAYVVALTGLASRSARDEAEQSGFDDYLTKPISFAKIGELLVRLSAEKRGHILS